MNKTDVYLSKINLLYITVRLVQFYIRPKEHEMNMKHEETQQEPSGTIRNQQLENTLLLFVPFTWDTNHYFHKHLKGNQ